MLQQTQVSRVEKKFKEFINIFPHFKSLAKAPLKDVLTTWRGMGYNRRAKYLKTTAEIITQKYNGRLPQKPDILRTLPGIGPNTANSICAFAFNIPVVFIETNIRSVFIHEFFSTQKDVLDKDILALVAETLDKQNPREWYSALMDYGTMIKETYGNPNKKSKHYTKQSKFKGSDREIRGKIIKLLTKYNTLTKNQIIKKLGEDPDRITHILHLLIHEKLVDCKDKKIIIY